MASIWEWIPGAKIVYHITKTVKGTHPEDYAGCAPTASACEASATVAIQQCKDCVESKMMQFMKDWVGFPLPADAIGAIASGVIGKTGAALARAQGGKWLGTTAAAWSGIGTAIAIAEAADIVIVILKLFKIRQGAQAAKGMWCRCG